MAGWGQIPSQPSNYVTILHLRERWLKQKQLEQQEQQQKVQGTETEEKNDQKPEDVKPPVVDQKPLIHASSWSRNGSGKFQRYYRAEPASNPRNVNETCKKTEGEGEPLQAAPRIDRDAKKKKSKRKSRKKNPSAQKEEMDRTSPTPEENLKEETRETECKAGVQNGKGNVRTRRIDKKEGTASQCRPETGYTHEMKEMENKLSRFSVSFETKRGRNNGVYRGSSLGNRNFRDHRNVHPSAPRKQMNVGMIWVRKDEFPKGA